MRIPKGLVGLGAAKNAPNHGFTLAFAENHDECLDCIFVNADCDVYEFVEQDPDELNGYEPPEFHVLERKRTKTKLDGIAADKSWERMKRESDGALYVEIGIGLERGVMLFSNYDSPPRKGTVAADSDKNGVNGGISSHWSRSSKTPGRFICFP